MKGCSLLSNGSCVYFLMLRCIGKYMKLVHSVMSRVPVPLQPSHSNHSSWLLGSKMNKPACSFWKMKLDLETRKVCFELYTLQTAWIHSTSDFNQDLLSAVQQMLVRTFPWPLSCARERITGESLPFEQTAHHSLRVRRMQGQKQTNIGSQ